MLKVPVKSKLNLFTLKSTIFSM